MGRSLRASNNGGASGRLAEFPTREVDMIRRLLDLRHLRFPWPWLKKYQRQLRSVSNSIVWWEAWRSKLSEEMRYVACPGCGVEIDLGAESWRRRDGPCSDGNYWCLNTYGNSMPLGDYQCCGCHRDD